MRRIEPLAPERCPSCGAMRSFHVDGGAVRCARCAYVHGSGAGEAFSDAELEALFGDAAGADGAPASEFDAALQRRRERYMPSYILRHRDRSEIDAYTEAIFSTAMDHVRRKDWDGAIHHLRRAVDYNRYLTDAHLWLARLLPGDEERRQHLKHVLANDLQHVEALKELMILDGELDPEQRVDDFSMPEVRSAGTVAAQSSGLRCPRCGAPKLDADKERPGTLACSACGHEIAAPTGGGDRNVMRALIRKRAQAVEWIVGGRVLNCNGCGAQRTFAAEQLAELCPFCGSRNVVTQDATGSLAQPDSVLPFLIDEREATDAVREALSSGIERLKGWFSDNRARRIIAEAVFLPFWAFDVAADVTRTYRVQNEGEYRLYTRSEAPGTTITENFADAAYNVMIPAVAQPPAWLLARIGQFDTSGGVAYSPEQIAQHSAEIYTRDFDKASLEAHSVISQAMRDKYSTSGGSEVTISVFTLVKPISFRLLLVPVWAATIHEKDGDVRPALVNGQTGKVAFGKAARPG